MLTTSPSKAQLILRTERDLQGPCVQEGEGRFSLPLNQVLPVGKPSTIWVKSSGPAIKQQMSHSAQPQLQETTGRSVSQQRSKISECIYIACKQVESRDRVHSETLCEETKCRWAEPELICLVTVCRCPHTLQQCCPSTINACNKTGCSSCWFNMQ